MRKGQVRQTDVGCRLDERVPSLQPRRGRIRERVQGILEAAPVYSGWLPKGYSYRDLACQIYGVPDPSPAQLSAVRRVVARLVAEDRAVRVGRGSHRRGSGTHVRHRHGLSYVYANPVGVEVRRALTDDEQAQRHRLAAAKKAGLITFDSALNDVTKTAAKPR